VTVLQKYILIALGGSLGSLARFWVGSTIASRLGTRLPFGTFVINITACIVIGFSLAFLGRHTEVNLAWRFLIPVGFVGAYSTFSTFEWETFPICKREHFSLQLCMSFLACCLV
jgi:fluoride exporter